VGVVIFVKNEAMTIGALIDGVSRFIGLNNIFVMDGHSNDGTISAIKAKKAQLYFDKREGKGSAVRLAINEIKRDVLILMDSDGSHRPEEIPYFLEPFYRADDVDMVIGSRFKGGSEELFGSLSEIIRLLGNALSTLLINIIWRAGLTDVQNGFRAVRRKAILEVRLVEDGFAIEQEMVIRLLKHRKKIIEVPSYELKRKFNKSHIVPFKMMIDCIFCFTRNYFWSK